MGGYPCCCDGGGGGTTFTDCADALSNLLTDYPYAQFTLSSISVLDSAGCGVGDPDNPPSCSNLSTGPYNAQAMFGNGYYGTNSQAATLCGSSTNYGCSATFNCTNGLMQCTVAFGGVGDPSTAASGSSTGNDIKTMIEDWYNDGTPIQFTLDDTSRACGCIATMTPLVSAP